VDFHPRDVIAHSAQGILHYAPDLIGQRLVTFDCVVRIDLDLHADLLSDCLIKDVFYAHRLPLRSSWNPAASRDLLLPARRHHRQIVGSDVNTDRNQHGE